jgi:hypothetical protein
VRHFLQRNGGFNKKLEAFSKITRLFEDIDMRLFQRIGGFLKLFPDKWRFFSLMWHILKDSDAF